MKTIYIGAENERDAIGILNDMFFNNYFSFYDEETLQQADVDDVDYDEAYCHSDAYPGIMAIFNPKAFKGLTVYSVDVEEM